MINKDQIRNLLIDIRFWIIFFFIIRLTGITNAPLESGHNWRQSLTNMIARNFLENGVNFLFPTIDMAGNKPGIIGSEFPFFNFLIYLFADIFGYEHWYGRLINLMVSSIGVYYFYLLIKNLFDHKIAFNATIVLLTSIWFAFSRKIMPDTFSIALVIIGLYYVVNYIRTSKIFNLFLFFIFCTLGVLCKIPALCLMISPGIIIFIRGIDLKRKFFIAFIGMLCLLVVYAWYFYWVPYLVETYYFQLYFPKGIREGLSEIVVLIPELLEKFYFSSLQSYIAFACFLAGLILIIKNENKFIVGFIAMVTSIFIVFILKTGEVFPTHNYYVIPFTPIMAFIAGYFIAKIKPPLQYILLFIIAVEGIANQQHDFFIRENQLYKLTLEEKAEKIIPKNDLIVINGGPSPQDIYFLNKKGWTIESDKLNDTHFIDSLSGLGAKYLIIDKSKTNQVYTQYKIEYTDNYYTIYKLD